MKRYQAAIKKHLGEYARRRLGVFEEGVFKGGHYSHILPWRLRFLNFLESYRAELQHYCSSHRSIKLHRFFHHLNSSQAFAFNLFFPYFSSPGYPAEALSAALGIRGRVSDWEFEHIVDEIEGTNIDVMWHSDTALVFCEVKLSEAEFGTAVDDDRHRKKLSDYYQKRLSPLVSADLLHENTFFKNYQLLRNIALLAEHAEHQLVILLPRENESLAPSLHKILAGVNPEVRGRIKVAYIEHCILVLAEDPALSPELRVYASQLAEKYLVSPSAKMA
jgi:hypothetical protein